MMTGDWSYYQPSTTEQSESTLDTVLAETLDSDSRNGTNSRVHVYLLKKSTDRNEDNARFFLMNPAGVAPFQPAEFLFSQMKYRRTRLPETVTGHTTSMHGFKVAL